MPIDILLFIHLFDPLYLFAFSPLCHTVDPDPPAEISADGAEGLRGALRFPPGPDLVEQPSSSAAVPPIGDVVGRREHERRGLCALLAAHHALLTAHTHWYLLEHIFHFKGWMSGVCLHVCGVPTGPAFTGSHEPERTHSNSIGEHKVRFKVC